MHRSIHMPCVHALTGSRKLNSSMDPRRATLDTSRLLKTGEVLSTVDFSPCARPDVLSTKALTLSVRHARIIRDVDQADTKTPCRQSQRNRHPRISLRTRARRADRRDLFA